MKRIKTSFEFALDFYPVSLQLCMFRVWSWGRGSPVSPPGWCWLSPARTARPSKFLLHKEETFPHPFEVQHPLYVQVCCNVHGDCGQEGKAGWRGPAWVQAPRPQCKLTIYCRRSPLFCFLWFSPHQFGVSIVDRVSAGNLKELEQKKFSWASKLKVFHTFSSYFPFQPLLPQATDIDIN